MSTIIVTHAECGDGFDPGLTPDGEHLTVFGISNTVPCSIRNVFVGIGNRFRRSYCLLEKAAGLKPDWVAYTPIVGTMAIARKTRIGMMVSLGNGLVIPMEDYVYPVQAPGFDVWQWLSSLPDNSMICTEPAFLEAIGIKDAQGQLGQAYWVDPRAADGERIAQL